MLSVVFTLHKIQSRVQFSLTTIAILSSWSWNQSRSRTVWKNITEYPPHSIHFQYCSATLHYLSPQTLITEDVLASEYKAKGSAFGNPFRIRCGLVPSLWPVICPIQSRTVHKSHDLNCSQTSSLLGCSLCMYHQMFFCCALKIELFIILFKTICKYN